MLINSYRFAAAGTPWTPAQITTALWLDAADAATITTVSGAVGQWNDKSGNGRNASQATAANRPTYSLTSFNGKPGISGDGIDDILLMGTTPMHGQSSFYVHCVLERLGTATGVLLGNRSYNGSIVRNFDIDIFANASSSGVNASSLIIANGSNTNNNSIRSTPTNSLTNGFVGHAAVQWDTGQTPTIWINGASQVLTNWVNAPNTAQQWDAVDPGLGIFGSSVAYSNTPAQCRIAEIIIINASITTDTRQRIEGYLAHKWGLTANLPAGHPYKSTAPFPDS